MTHFKLDELYTLFEQQNPYAKTVFLTGVATDSQEDVMGKLFIALSGEKVDGHSLIQEAERKGAACALVQKGYKNPYVTIPLLEVESPEFALLQIAKQKLRKTSTQVIALTGSLGKSIVKEFVYTLIKSKHKIAKTCDEHNSQEKLAKFLINDICDEAYIVCELAMSQVQELAEILAPDIAVVCSLTYEHSSQFASQFETITATEIFPQDACKTAIINYDIPQVPLLLQKATGKKLTYSTQSLQADIKLQIEDNRLIFVERGTKTSFSYTYFPAEHLYSNFLAAVLVAREIGMTYDEIQNAAPQLKTPPGRMQVIQKPGITFIHDAHSASEVSTKAALAAMQKKYCKSKKIAVVGSMNELGAFSDSCYKNIGKFALSCVDRLFCFGKECAPLVQLWKDEARDVSWHEESSSLIEELRQELQDGDLVLLKGSRSVAFERILEAF